MKTAKLYETDPYVSRFTATVLSCEKDGGVYKSALDKTAFFPEAGGQPCDTGTLSDIKVFDVQIRGDEIFHYTKSPLTAGEKVTGEIDFDRRFNFMQNHTAEHIVSGLVFKKHGFDNIGFHLSESEVTFDFNGFFTSEELYELEYEANKRVWQSLKVECFYPAAELLESIKYRSKEGIYGDIRLVKIENTDICACCAPHVKNTGEIGIIKFTGTEKQHGGTRIFMKCGGFALADYRKKDENIKSISSMLSAKTDTVREAVLSLKNRLDGEKQLSKSLKAELLEFKIHTFDKSKKAILVDGADMRDLQFLADGLHRKYGGVRTALSQGGNNTLLVMCGDTREAEEEWAKLKTLFDIKGGGRDKMRQGNITGSADKIKEYFGV